MKTVIYPGSFDPVHNGHLDIVNRAVEMFPSVTVAVSHVVSKEMLFTPEERVAMLREVTEGMVNVRVVDYSGLTVAFARQCGASAILKGLRTMGDFEYELRMAMMNRHLAGDLDTVFLMTSPEWAFLSSTLIKEVVRLGGGVEGLVPARVAAHLRRKFEKGGSGPWTL
ncbi:MAG: pantetheine-phosphate adenylyltransferase [Armatimonadetes bacterium]|nr:pantetheine-phosphate adenylyltransferase [Armatimonadota bacterium]